METTRKRRPRAWDKPDILWLPPAFLKRMEENGYTVRWLRWRDPESVSDDRIDRKLPQRQYQGWEFVKPADIVEWEHPPTIDHAKLGSLVAVGDLAAAILPTEWFEEDRGNDEKKASDMMRAVRQNLQQLNSDKRFPISDESRTQVTGGPKVARFGD